MLRFLLDIFFSRQALRQLTIYHCERNQLCGNYVQAARRRGNCACAGVCACGVSIPLLLIYPRRPRQDRCSITCPIDSGQRGHDLDSIPQSQHSRCHPQSQKQSSSKLITFTGIEFLETNLSVQNYKVLYMYLILTLLVLIFYIYFPSNSYLFFLIVYKCYRAFDSTL